MSHHASYLAAALSLVVPGLGQLHNGERAKGISILCITVGIWFWLAMTIIGPSYFHSWFSQIVLVIAYLFVLAPAVTDAYHGVSPTAQSVISSGKPWYVIFMVVVIGAMAVPLVWQSPRLSRTAKIVWSALGILNTLLSILLLVVLGPIIERSLEEFSQILKMLQ